MRTPQERRKAHGAFGKHERPQVALENDAIKARVDALDFYRKPLYKCVHAPSSYDEGVVAKHSIGEAETAAAFCDLTRFTWAETSGN